MKYLYCVLLLWGLMIISPWAMAADLNASLQQFFKHGVVYDGAKAELVKVIRMPDIQGEVHWSLPSLRTHAARLSLLAEQTQANGYVRRWYVPVKVRWWAKVVTVRQELPARALLQASQLQVETQDVANHQGVFWTSIKPLVGMRLTRPLHAHSVVFSNAVKRPPLLKRGDRVEIVAGNALFSVRAEGVVMRPASLGERVLVRNMRSQERIQAVVVDKYTVRVHI